jgi:hypothetical protein
MFDKPLPIGSVVRLNGGEKKLMILGYLRYSKASKIEVYDYTACLYPEGGQDPSENFVFNHEDIDSIYALGYCEQGHEAFTGRLMELFKTTKGKEHF